MAADSSTSLEKRRVSKPLIEKRRRARINSSLAQLKEIVIKPSPKTQESRSNRLEKADILEMTVEYVKNVHKSSATQQSLKQASVLPHVDQDHSFQEGYRLCMLEVEKYLSNNHSKRTTKEFLSHSLQAYLRKTLFRQDREQPTEELLSNASVKEQSRLNHIGPNSEHRRYFSENSDVSSNSADDEMSEVSYGEDKARGLGVNSMARTNGPDTFSKGDLSSCQTMWRPW